MTKSLNDRNTMIAARPGAALCLFEDFNRPDRQDADAPPPPPTFSEVELAAAREEAWNDGYLVATKAAERRWEDQSRQVFEELMAGAQEMDRKLDEMAEHNAASVARWLIQTFVTAFPALSASAALARTQRVADLLHSTLRSHSRIEVRHDDGPTVTCETMEEAWRHIEARHREDPAAGDIVVAWPQGQVLIDPQRAWEEIRAAILPIAADSGTEPFHMTIKQGEYPNHVG
jgi:hypothetical protein